jgi:hypothetical protein
MVRSGPKTVVRQCRVRLDEAVRYSSRWSVPRATVVVVNDDRLGWRNLLPAFAGWRLLDGLPGRRKMVEATSFGAMGFAESGVWTHSGMTVRQ